MISVKIREEIRTDFDEIKALLENAFEGSEEADLVERIRNSTYYIPKLSLVATYRNKVVGHILLSKIKINSRNHIISSLALAPVSVLKKFQRQGIGAKLIMTGLEKATLMGYKSVILLGHSDYYPRFGFEPTSIWEIKPPFDVPEENFMGIELVPKGLNCGPGIVEYPEVWNL